MSKAPNDLRRPVGVVFGLGILVVGVFLLLLGTVGLVVGVAIIIEGEINLKGSMTREQILPDIPLAVILGVIGYGAVRLGWDSLRSATQDDS